MEFHPFGEVPLTPGEQAFVDRIAAQVDPVFALLRSRSGNGAADDRVQRW
jgi:hypothetical protein